MAKSLKELSVEDAITVAKIIRPWIPIENFYVIRNDQDYIVLRNDSYMVEEIWFAKTTSYGNMSIIGVYHQRASVDLDFVYLAYRKLMDLGYSLDLPNRKIKDCKY